MKFLLGFIAVIVISLATYVMVGSSTKQQVQKEVSKTVQPKEKVIETVPIKAILKKVTLPKAETPKDKVVSVKKVVPSVEDSTNIDNDEFATEVEYHPNDNKTSDEPISDEEWNSVEKQMIQTGQISQEDKPTSDPADDSTNINNDEFATEVEYHLDDNKTSDEPISDEEWNSVEKQMIQTGQISQENDFSASTENLGYDPSELAGEI